MDESTETHSEVTPIQETGTELVEPVVNNTTSNGDQLEQVIEILHQDDSLHTIVTLPNGSEFDFVAKVTLGDALITVAIFLLLAFFVVKWLLDEVWRR